MASRVNGRMQYHQAADVATLFGGGSDLASAKSTGVNP